MLQKKDLVKIIEHVTCEILITNKCNLNCHYCIARDLPGPPMTKEIGQKAVDLMFFLSEGAKSLEFIFSGGEPLLEYLQIIHLVDYINQRGIETGIQISFILKTNGTILNSKVLDIISKHSIKVVISIDGPQNIHDEHRISKDGKGSYHLIKQNIYQLIENNIEFSASLTVHPNNAKSVKKNVQWLFSNLGIKNIDIGPAYGTVEWSELDIDHFTQSLFDLAILIKELHNNGQYINISPLEKESDHINGKLTHSWGCHAASSNLAFLPNGNITGCSALAMLVSKFPELIIGNVQEGIMQIPTDKLVLLAQADQESRPNCNKCLSASNCTGGCLAINYATSGVGLYPPQIYCNTIATLPETLYQAWGIQ